MAAVAEFLDEFSQPWPQVEAFIQPYISDISVPLTFLALYLGTIYGLQAVMRAVDAKPLRLSLVVALHNFFLCAWSLVMAVGLSWTLFRGIQRHGLVPPYCGVGPNDIYDRSIVFWSQVFYFSKYYELLDTLFLVIRRKPLNFLHVYHHSIVMFVCHYGVQDRIIMGFIAAWSNATVHVLMYYYYGVRELGQFPWWRRWLTTIQIVQFVNDCFTSMFWPYFVYVAGIPCSGSLRSWGLANFAGATFFVLFMNFYRAQYSTPRKTPAPAGDATARTTKAARSKKD